jgi:hypothetical protein
LLSAPARSRPRGFAPHIYGSRQQRVFWVENPEGTRLAYVYFSEGGPIPAANAAKHTRDEARRIARNIAKLPGCCGSVMASVRVCL